MKKESVVVDTNLIFAALIPRASKIRDTLFDDKYSFFCPNFVISAIELKCPIWTGDKKLKDGLELRKFGNFFIG